MKRLAAASLVCLALISSVSMAHAAERDTDAGGGFDLSPVAKLPAKSAFRVASSLALPPVQTGFFYQAPVPLETSRWQLLTSRFQGNGFPFNPAQGVLSSSHPAFGQVGILPLYADGMLRRFPQAPENSSMSLREFGHMLREQMSLTAGLRALDRSHGVAAAIGFTTRFGRLSVERGLGQGSGLAFSMQPVTVVRFELPRL